MSPLLAFGKIMDKNKPWQLNLNSSKPTHVTGMIRRVTYQAIEHLIQDSPEAPPVHCPVIRLLVEHLWCEILERDSRKGG